MSLTHFMTVLCVVHIIYKILYILNEWLSPINLSKQLVYSILDFVVVSRLIYTPNKSVTYCVKLILFFLLSSQIWRKNLERTQVAFGWKRNLEEEERTWDHLVKKSKDLKKKVTFSRYLLKSFILTWGQRGLKGIVYVIKGISNHLDILLTWL